jgi:diguanylate cyclase (GGDEF)-like protein
MNVLGPLLTLILPAAIVAGALMVITRPALVPGAIVDLVPQVPYAAAVIVIVLGLVFHRGRVVFAGLGIAIAYAAFHRFVFAGGSDLAARATFIALCALAPIVIAALAWLEERRTINLHGVARLALIIGACALPTWVVTRQRGVVLDWAYAPLSDALHLATPIPQIPLALMTLSLIAVIVAAIMYRSVVVAGLAWTLVALFIALQFSNSPFAFATAITAAEAVLGLAVLQDTYRMAFRDELTGLPGRRALNEALNAIGRRYAVAMVDVDHFKQFNDQHGHDVGDQVLRLVATRLARVGGGGRAFRYGGEEFALLFPGKSADETVPHVNALRDAIEHYQIAIRSPDRPLKPRNGKRRRRSPASVGKTVSVTVSVGVASGSPRGDPPEDVMRSADQALYRAKRAGRNRVSV